jgi:uncharacterized protein
MTQTIDLEIDVYAAAESLARQEHCTVGACATTQGTMLRLHMMYASDKSPAAAWQTLAVLEAHPRHVFWNAGFGYRQVAYHSLSGPRQVTDAWLAELARRNGAKLLTLDEGLVALHRDVAVLLPQ